MLSPATWGNVLGACHSWHVVFGRLDCRRGESPSLTVTFNLFSLPHVSVYLDGMAPSRDPATTPRQLHKTLSNHRGPVHVARYAKGTAKYVLSGGQDRTIRLWNPDLGTEIKSYSAHGYEVLSITV